MSPVSRMAGLSLVRRWSWVSFANLQEARFPILQESAYATDSDLSFRWRSISAFGRFLPVTRGRSSHPRLPLSDSELAFAVVGASHARPPHPCNPFRPTAPASNCAKRSLAVQQIQLPVATLPVSATLAESPRMMAADAEKVARPLRSTHR